MQRYPTFLDGIDSDHNGIVSQRERSAMAGTCCRILGPDRRYLTAALTYVEQTLRHHHHNFRLLRDDLQQHSLLLLIHPGNFVPSGRCASHPPYVGSFLETSLFDAPVSDLKLFRWRSSMRQPTARYSFPRRGFNSRYHEWSTRQHAGTEAGPLSPGSASGAACTSIP